MTQALFYLMSSDNDLDRLKYACLLAEKSYRKNKSVFIHSENNQQSHEIDKLLWSVRDNSFIPHQIHDSQSPRVAPITISHQKSAKQQQQVVINLSTGLTVNADTQWVLEVVHQRSDIKTLSRANWRQYQQQGITPSIKHC